MQPSSPVLKLILSQTNLSPRCWQLTELQLYSSFSLGPLFNTFSNAVTKVEWNCYSSSAYSLAASEASGFFIITQSAGSRATFLFWELLNPLENLLVKRIFPPASHTGSSQNFSYWVYWTIWPFQFFFSDCYAILLQTGMLSE